MAGTSESNFPSGSPEDEELFRVQLHVAQRADELARVSADGSGVERDRATWLLAETQAASILSRLAGWPGAAGIAPR